MKVTKTGEVKATFFDFLATLFSRELWRESWKQFRMPKVRPPVNVRIEYPNGVQIPVELYYAGVDPKERLHEWKMDKDDVLVLREGWKLKADVIPPKTCLNLNMRNENESDHQDHGYSGSA